MGRVATLLRQKRGILLDISRGGTPQPGAVTLTELGHDPTRVPFPFPKSVVHTAVVTHVLEYLDPTDWYRWWDGLHRIMRPHGHVYVSGPYGGDESWGWLSDPTHRIRVVEQTFAWLDPRTPFYEEGPKPRPWHPLTIARVPGPHGTTSYNVLLEAQPWPSSASNAPPRRPAPSPTASKRPSASSRPKSGPSTTSGTARRTPGGSRRS